ncbi:PilW family protein [Pseudomonas sp.]|uniref:PilW family protein n=1 Tax=Pseudomonas sp. TaxID=306 RepID=UPI0027306F57|nr:PilW family protein [Pseudomonas sp.]MDP2244420.1 PilW family protein [Pseudomonas sp.]
MSHRRQSLQYRQCGMSIVELLVALVISLLLMTGVVQVFLSSKQTYASNESASRLQENGRFALEFIAQSARHAGYVEAANLSVSLPSTIASPGNGICNDSGTCSSQGVDEESDNVAFVLQPRIQDNLRRDCLGVNGTGTHAINDTDIIINQFVIIEADPANGEPHPALGCRSRNTRGGWVTGATAQRLIDGIDALQVQYGISTGGDTSSVNQYVSADRVSNWENVLAVRIAVLANSMNAVSPPAPARQYVLLDAAPISFNDGKSRQIFTTTIKLRNTY